MRAITLLIAAPKIPSALSMMKQAMTDQVSMQ